MSENPGQNALIALRLTEAERRHIEQQAARHGWTISQTIRERLGFTAGRQYRRHDHPAATHTAQP